MGEQLQYTIRTIEPHTQVVAVVGEIDVYTVEVLRKGVLAELETGRSHVVLNLDGVRYIDSAGLALVLEIFHRCKRVDGALSIICNEPRILKVFALTGLGKVVAIHADEERALEAP